MDILKWLPIVLRILILGSCGSSTLPSKEAAPNNLTKINSVNLKIETIHFNEHLSPDKSMVYGAISLLTSQDSIFIDLTNVDITSFKKEFGTDSAFIYNTKFIYTNFVGYNRKIVDDFGKRPNWVKLEINSSNKFNFYNSFDKERQQDTLYFGIPFRINNVEIQKVFKFHNNMLINKN